MDVAELIAAARNGNTRAAGRLLSLVESERRDDVLAVLGPAAIPVIGGEVPFVETVFNPWNQAEKISSKQEVQRLKREEPQKLLDALENLDDVQQVYTNAEFDETAT